MGHTMHASTIKINISASISVALPLLLWFLMKLDGILRDDS